MKTKTELKNIAKERLVEALSVAYYDIAAHPDKYGLTEGEADIVINELMHKYGESMARAIGRKYYTQ